MSRPLHSLFATLASAIVVLGTYGCAALARPTERDARYAAKHWPGTTLAQLEQGRALFVETCAGCHTLKDPASRSPSQWQAEVTQMRGKKGVKLDDRQAQLIVRYLSTISSRQKSQVAER